MKTLLLVVLFVVCVAGHGILIQPTPRAGTNQGTGVKIVGASTGRSNTCGTEAGSNTAGAITTTYQSGSQIKITWDTTIAHASPPGVRIAMRWTATDDFDDNVLVDGVDIGKNGCHSTTIQLPAGKTCNNCVLQWMWESTADGGFYIGCSAAVAPTTNKASDDYRITACGPDTPANNQKPGSTTPEQEGLSGGGKAAIALVMLGLAGAVIGTIVFVKGGYGTVDGKFPFYHKKSKVIADQRSSGNYVAYVDNDA